MTLEELESLLECKIILVDEESIPEHEGIRAMIRLFHAPSQPSSFFVLCIIGDFDDTGYDAPTPELLNIIYKNMTNQVKRRRLKLGPLTDTVENCEIKDNEGTIISMEERLTKIQRWHTAVIVDQGKIAWQPK